MRIGFVARRLEGQRLGIGRYIEYVLKHWEDLLLPSEEVALYLRRPLDDQPLDLSDDFRLRVLQPRLTGVLWENLVLPVRATDVDVLFGPSYTVPLAYRGRTVVATHSTNEVQPGAHPWTYQYTYAAWYRQSARKAERVIVPSESTKSDVQERYGISEDRIDVVREGVDDAFQPVEDEEVLQRTRVRFLGRNVPYILFVGKFSQRRNIPTLMAAFSQLKHRDGIPHHLLLVGPNPLGLPLEELAARLGISDCFVQTEGRFASHREIIPVYSAADVYAYPSTYDGFSLTVVEAMACGTPVVCMNRAALREIADGCALMLDELSVDILAGALRRALSDTQLRRELRAKALSRAAGLRLRDTAEQTLDVLRKVAAS